MRCWLIMACVLWALPANAATYTAASCSRADVNAVINGPTHVAVHGDIIQIPATGSPCTWTSQLVVSAGITIIGTGSPTIIQNYNGTLLAVTISSATANFRLSGLTIQAGASVGVTPAIASLIGTCNASTCSHVSIDTLSLTNWTTGPFLFYANDVFGVFYGITATGSGNSFLLVNIGYQTYLHSDAAGSYGDRSWASSESFGSRNALYLEDNTIGNVAASNALTDTDNFPAGGARFVVRFNTFTNVSVQTHGTESTGRNRGSRQVEVYHNALTCDGSGAGGNCINLVGLRSGTAYTFNNAFTVQNGGNFQREITLANYRVGTSFSPWGVCGGTAAQSLWDENDGGAPFDSGTVTSASRTNSLTVTDTGQSWTTSQWVSSGSPYSIVNTSRTDARGFYPAAEISANTSNTITATYDAWSGTAEPDWQVGDSFEIRRATTCIDQIGRGSAGATYLSGSTPSPTGWLNQPRVPIYQWGSTVTGASISEWVLANNPLRITNNRDFYYKAASFTGASGTGSGTSRPATCTTGVAYWETDEGEWNSANGATPDGRLYICTSTNTWTLSYTPYTYPHPLRSAPSAPSSVAVAGTSTPALCWTAATGTAIRYAVQVDSDGFVDKDVPTHTSCGDLGISIASLSLDPGAHTITVQACNVTGCTSATPLIVVKL